MEETNTTMETTGNQTDEFLTGYDGSGPEMMEPETIQEEVTGGATEEDTASAADTTEEVTSETTTQEEPEAAEPEPAAPQQVWNIKLNRQERIIKPEEITSELLQKGFDYDRIREKYDEAQPIMQMMHDFAQASGMTVSEYAQYLRTEAKKASGMDEAEAKREIDLEDREAALRAKEATEQEEREDKEAYQQRVQADVAEFAKAFPDIYEKAKTDKTAIPKSVWDEVNKGLSLVAAYARYAVGAASNEAKAVKVRAEATAKNQTNAGRSTGSMRSAGNDVKVTDDFLDGYNG